jgi:peroxiredoxin
MHQPSNLPDNLPIPVDDGAADHLTRRKIPVCLLESTAGGSLDVGNLSHRAVLFCYPRTGRPSEEVPAGWDEIPGARGCTPQTCSFRDLFADLQKAGVSAVFGISTQTAEYQKEAASRLHLPYPLLSDHMLRFAQGLRLPTFDFAGQPLLKRLTMIVDEGRITKVFYPVFPPNESAATTLAWIQQNPATTTS